MGLIASSNLAVVASLSPDDPNVTLVPAGYTGGDVQPRVVSAARSITRNHIGLYRSSDLGGSGAPGMMDHAVAAALSTLGRAPAGPKWVLLLSDGLAGVSTDSLAALHNSGAHWRSFAIGDSSTCSPYASMYKMAAATGEACVRVGDPATLSAGVVGSPPDAVNGVTVTIDRVSVAATVDAIGSWAAQFTLGEGTYTATVRGVLAYGATVTAQRTFTVGPALAEEFAAAGQRHRWAGRRQGHDGKGDPPRAYPRKPAITCDRPGWSPRNPPGHHREASRIHGGIAGPHFSRRPVDGGRPGRRGPRRQLRTRVGLRGARCVS